MCKQYRKPEIFQFASDEKSAMGKKHWRIKTGQDKRAQNIDLELLPWQPYYQATCWMVKNSTGKQNRLSLSNANKTQVSDFATSPDFSTVLKEPTVLVTGQDKSIRQKNQSTAVPLKGEVATL